MNILKKHNSTITRSTGKTPEEVFKNANDVFREVKKLELEEIENAFTRRTTRLVSNVNEISYESKNYMVPKYKGCSLQNMKIEVRENPNKWIKLFYKGNFLIKYELEGKKDEEK